MATPEGYASQEVRKRASQWKARIFRNNSGVLTDKSGRPVRFGLGNESSKVNKEFKTGDYVGWFPVTITPDMVGKTIAVFANIECKAVGFTVKLDYNANSREYAQDKFNKLVINQGGIAGFAWDWQSVDKLVNDFYERIQKSEQTKY